MVAEASEISFASEALYVLNQFKAVPSGPNQFSSLSRGILWSTVSNAAVTSRSARIDTFLLPALNLIFFFFFFTSTVSVLCPLLKPGWKLVYSCSAQTNQGCVSSIWVLLAVFVNLGKKMPVSREKFTMSNVSTFPPCSLTYLIMYF